MAGFSPALPRRAETRLSASFVLGSTKSSTYPTWERAVLAAQGRAGGNWPPPVFVLSAALLDDHFEHPTWPLCAVIIRFQETLRVDGGHTA